MTRQEHLLVCLIEECAEVSQRATKALRFGLPETQPGQEWTNAHRLHDELCDLLAILDLLEATDAIAGFLSPDVDEKIQAKKEKFEKYLAYSRELGL